MRDSNLKEANMKSHHFPQYDEFFSFPSKVTDKEISKALAHYHLYSVAEKTVQAIEKNNSTVEWMNLWQETCLVIQGEIVATHPHNDTHYEKLIEEEITKQLDQLPLLLKHTMWLYTEEGEWWREEVPEERFDYDYKQSDIAHHIASLIHEKALTYHDETTQSYWRYLEYEGDDSANYA